MRSAREVRQAADLQRRKQMVYWVIMAVLFLIAIGLIVAIVVTLKSAGKRDNYDDGNKYKRENEIEEDDDYPQPARARQRSRAEREPEQAEEIPRRNAKKQWKIILENLETWEKPSYIFYDNIGIGRSRSDGEFEKFLVIREDPRVSKVHCAIIRKEDKLYLKDMGSRNGTFLNGQRIHQPDDVIGVDGTKTEVKKVLRER